jgi:hypothetical protein
MTPLADGAIDCDIHPGVPNIKALLPYMDEFWHPSSHAASTASTCRAIR